MAPQTTAEARRARDRPRQTADAWSDGRRRPAAFPDSTVRHPPGHPPPSARATGHGAQPPRDEPFFRRHPAASPHFPQGLGCSGRKARSSGAAGIPNSYADVEIDEAVLRDYYGWSPGVDASYEHEISPRELEVACEAEDSPPVDQATFLAWTERSDFPYAKEILEIARRTAPAAAPWDGIRRAMQAKAQEKRGEEEEADSWEREVEELADPTSGMLRARNTDRVPLGWFAALIAEGPADGGGGINDAPEEQPDHLAEIAQELEIVRCLNAAAASAEGTYHWPEPERQAQDEGAKEQVAETLIEHAQQPGFFRGEQPPAPGPEPAAAAPCAGGDVAPPGAGFAGTPPASLASVQEGPGAPPRQHPDPEHNNRERVSQAPVLKLLSEDFPGYIRMAFPKIYQTGRGCPTEKPPDLEFLAYCMGRGEGRWVGEAALSGAPAERGPVSPAAAQFTPA